MRPVVAIVGRPNVGKSTLFNRLLGERIAIVEDRPGVTRDRLYGQGSWQNKEYTLIDTGGLSFDGNDEMVTDIQGQVKMAIQEADLVLLIVDAVAGIMHLDNEIALMLRRSQKPTLLVANKVDHLSQEQLIHAFSSLGFNEIWPVSSTHGHGTGDLLDRVIASLPPESWEDQSGDDERIKVAIVGRPNVGKSSLLNSLLGCGRVVVSDVAGTTRDAVDVLFKQDGEEYLLIDTAGIKRRGKVDGSIERYSLMRSKHAIERADVCLLVLDGGQGIVEQDKKVAGFVQQAGKSLLFVINKWDLVDSDEAARFSREVHNQFKFLHYAPVVSVSAKTGRHISRLMPTVTGLSEQYHLRLPTSLINKVLHEAFLLRPAPTHKGRRLQLRYVTQIATCPPTFLCFVNDVKLAHFSYMRYLENHLRSAIDFTGTPIKLLLRQSKRDDE